MAVEDDLRRLSQMQAIYLSWQSFFAQVCTPNKWNNQERARHPDVVALSERRDGMRHIARDRRERNQDEEPEKPRRYSRY
jgi:hypothetical protein